MAWFITYHTYLKTLEYIVFGLYRTDDYSRKKYTIYKLTKDELYIDKSETWHTKHDFGKEYKFHGYKASNEKYQLVEELLHNVPRIILSKKIKKYGDNFGSKLQDNLIIEVFDGEQKTNIIIDSYIKETEELPVKLREFRLLVESFIKKLESIE
ncbi:hypothetical protein [Kordia sp.]|uniref:hypothetical protein n=1 Tax=Kordia sp. TaxID=1965332 RepID=UPI003B5BAFDD